MSLDQDPDSVTAEWRRSIEDRLDQGSERMALFDEKLERNTSLTEDVHEMLITWRAGMNAIAKFGRGLGWVGTKLLRIARWGATVAAPIIAAGVAVWAWLHNGAPK